VADDPVAAVDPPTPIASGAAKRAPVVPSMRATRLNVSIVSTPPKIAPSIERPIPPIPLAHMLSVPKR
jgi:hypothetical protein